jgi:hypothetical protein
MGSMRRSCFCVILSHHLQTIFNHITALTCTDKTLQAYKMSFSIEPISLLSKAVKIFQFFNF